MTDLTGKFTGFESLIGLNHLEIMAALNGIGIALGAPPVTPTVSLADVNNNLIAINNNLIGMRTANATFHASMLSLTGLINVNTDTLINNSSLNAQRMIAAIYATFCACETTTPLVPEPLEVTPTPLIDDAKCRRIQYYLSVFTTWLQSIASYGSTGAAVTGDVLQSLLVAAVAAAGGAVEGIVIGSAGFIPGAVVGAVVGAILGIAFAFGGAYLVAQSILFGSAPIQAALLSALYAANSAAEGEAAFQGTILPLLGLETGLLVTAMWFSSWSNEVYSDLPIVDDSMFDGTICAPPAEENCIVLQVAGDPGTSNYTYEGNTYGRIQTGALEFFARLQNDSTVYSLVPLFCSYGALSYTLPAATLITWGDLHTAIGGAYPFYMDSAIPAPSFTVEWCSLYDEEL